jgi:hypothetical protein
MIIAFSFPPSKERNDSEFTLQFFTDLLRQHDGEVIAYAYREGKNLINKNGTMTIAELEQS